MGVICFFLPIAQVHALDPNRLISQYGHAVWRSKEGTVPNSPAIAQTTDGYIWIAKRGNLWRFDGAQFLPWQFPKGAKLPGLVTCLLGARDGSLWIGTRTGVSRLRDGELSTYTKPSDQFGISTIIEDHAGKIWLTRYLAPKDEGGLCEVAGHGLHCYGKPDGFPANFGLGIAEDDTGGLWVAGEGNLYRWKPGTQASRYLDAAKQPEVVDVAVDRSGDVWAALDAAGLHFGVRYFHNGVWGEFTAAGIRSSTLWSNTLFVDRAGAVWIGTRNDGLYRIWMGTVDHFTPGNGLSGHDVGNIMEDREGNLWVSTDGGLDLFRNTPVITYSMDDGLSSSATNNVLALRDGTIWAGNDDGMVSDVEEPVNILQAGSGRRFSRGPTLPGGIRSLSQDHSGAIFLELGSYPVVYEHGKVERILGQNGQPFKDAVITAILEDPTQTILAVDHSKLLRIRDRRVINEVALPKSLITGGLLAVNPNGGIWVAGQRNGVMLYKDGILQDLPLPNSTEPIRIRSIFADPSDPLLMATSIGLLRWDGKQWQVIDEAKGLPCKGLIGAIKDRRGSLWLEADCGYLKAESSDLQRWRQNPESALSFTVFDVLDGADTGSARLAQPVMSLAPDGKVWTATGHNIQVIDPERVYRNPLPPPVYVVQLTADNRSYRASGEPQIPPNPRNLEIDYTGLSFTVPQRVLFRYFLEGHDKSWLGPVTRRQAFYTDLGPGTYRFHVIACNNSGVWNEAGAVSTFVVEPAFYQTLWFKALIALAIASLLWTLYFLRLKHATANVQRRLLAQMEERERIARELHDTLLQGFQGIALQVQGVTKTIPAQNPLRVKMESVLDRADEVLLEGRQRVRDLRQRTAGEEELPARLTKCGEKLAEEHTAGFSLAIVGSPVALESTVQDEAYMIAAEAMTNAFRHASASRIELEITYDSSELRIRVRDNGSGIDGAVLTNGHPGHWGLTGMRERAQAIRAVLNIWSRAAAGTEVELVIPASIAFSRKQKAATTEHLAADI